MDGLKVLVYIIPGPLYDTNTSGAHTHTVTAEGTITNTITPDALTTTATGALNGTTQAHTHSIALSNANTSEVADHTHTVTTDKSTTGAIGSGQTINIQNPYITVYMWRRIS